MWLRCVGQEPLHQRADGRKSSGCSPLIRDDVYSSGTPDIFSAGLAVRLRDGHTTVLTSAVLVSSQPPSAKVLDKVRQHSPVPWDNSR